MNTIVPTPAGANTVPDIHLPGQHVLYRHWAKDGHLLYAGRTNNPPARLGKHRAEAPWWALVSWTTYEGFPSLEALKDGEREAIRYEHPEWNIQGREHPAEPRRSQQPGDERYRPVTDRDMKPGITLVHPLSREFDVYGGDETVLRARKWALANRCYLLDSGPRCAHVFYRMDCPNAGHACLPYTDHTRVWVPAPDFSRFGRGPDDPFILMQPYYGTLGLDYPSDEDAVRSWPGNESDIPAEVASYAAAHGLDAESRSSDAWYYPLNCMPIRLAPISECNTPFPLVTETLSLMCAWRDNWPETVPEWLK